MSKDLKHDWGGQELKLFESVCVENYKNIAHTTLSDLGDVNVLIGPNNGGKSNLLRLISRLVTMNTGSDFRCVKCKKEASERRLSAPFVSLDNGSHSNGNVDAKIKVTIRFNREFLASCEDRDVKLGAFEFESECNWRNQPIELISETRSTNITPAHYTDAFSPDYFPILNSKLSNSCLYVPSSINERYQNQSPETYLTNKNLSSNQKVRFIQEFSNQIDQRIVDERNYALIRHSTGGDYSSSVSDQGFGIISSLPVFTELVNTGTALILIDDPETGLNQAAKIRMIRRIAEKASTNQIFIATQDPTFANPLLYSKIDLRIYMYSPLEDGFIGVDTIRNKDYLDTFCGYLPHTTSLKKFHLYVEGPSDVLVFNSLLHKFARDKFPQDWATILSKIGIFHLGGDLWQHLLYTIPGSPYSSLVILDGDKGGNVNTILLKYKASKVLMPDFRICKGPRAIPSHVGGVGKDRFAIYVLKRACLEEYLVEGYDCAHLPPDWDKVSDDVRAAEELTSVPYELRYVFKSVLETLGFSYRGV